MQKRISYSIILIGIGLVLLAACGPAVIPVVELPIATQQPKATVAPTAIPTEAATTAPTALSGDISRGGRLYDKWTEELGVDTPEGNQMLWASQSSNTRAGADTWRCKECHGWDYKGLEGAYGSGSHKTGFKGVMGVAGKDANEIIGMLKGSTNPEHDFSAYMDDQALTDLALFLSSALVDDSKLINADKSLMSGDAAAGKSFFDDTCKECHGPLGLGINFGNSAESEYQGTIAIDNPWEFLHKMRFGQPAVPDMPSVFDDGINPEDYANVLAYAATFPTSEPIAEGGVLYDNWMKAMGVEAPSVDQPLFASQTTNKNNGPDSWRCKECHGWDYKGADGVYGSGSHMTGFKGIADSASMSAEDLTAWLDGSKNPEHDFVDDNMLSEAQVQMMVAFIQSPKIDSSAFINADKTISGGNAETGREFFEANCAYCHGDDGKMLNFGDETEPEFLGTVAADNPWEFVHKVSFGHPGAHMPSGINMGWELQEFIDLISYAQSLPVK